MRGCSCIFVYIWIMTSYPGSRTIHQILWLKVFFDSRLQYESLEDLMDFLAFLVQKLWQKKQKLIREIHWTYSAMSSMIWGLLALTLASEMVRSRSRPLQLHIPAENTTKLWATISAHCRGDDVIIEQRKKPNLPFFWRHPPKTLNPNLKSFFSVQTTRLHESFEGSNSSLAYSSGELSKIVMPPVGDSMHFLQFSDFGVKWGFWAITVVPDMLEGQSRAL